jgi:NADPH-dependent glutamate synthase beta subunit-like oxidoreductase/ferredoxin
MNITLKIDNQDITVPSGTSVLDAAKTLGIHIPSMCYRNGFTNHPSCMVCLVKNKKTGALVSSCALKVTEGMEIITSDDEVNDARKEALELLLSDHVGDCEAPCSITCPAGMNIPEMNRLIGAGKFIEALNVVHREIALPYVLGYICPAPCEKACRRKQIDDAVSICMLKRFTADSLPQVSLPSFKDEKASVAIVGTGPAGLASAFYLLQNGCRCVLFDKNEKAGGALRYQIPDDQLPKEALDAEIDLLTKMGAEFRLNSPVSIDIFDEIRRTFKAVIVATGDIIVSQGLMPVFESTKGGISVSEDSLLTSISGVFAAGSVIRNQKMAVRAVAQGKSAALSVLDFLSGKEPAKTDKMFNSRFDKLTVVEYNEYLKDAITDKRHVPHNGFLQGFSEEEAIKEAKRCLHCDCRKMDNCKLRTYAHAYKADRRKYLLGVRKNVTRQVQHDFVVYESEKCIKCGLCISITLKNNELTGLAYTGRGFDVRIDVPFNRTIKEALQQSARECVEACPTGALAMK